MIGVLEPLIEDRLRVGVFQPGIQKTLRRPCGHSTLKGPIRKVGTGFLAGPVVTEKG